MKLSDVHMNGVILVRGKKAIVVERFPEDRSSGGTRLQLETGERQMYLWDQDDPTITYLGQGKITYTIELEHG